MIWQLDQEAGAAVALPNHQDHVELRALHGMDGHRDRDGTDSEVLTGCSLKC